MADTVSTIKERAGDVKDEVKDAAQDIAGEVKDRAREVGTEVRGRVGRHMAQGTETRVEETTLEEINLQIRRDLKARVLYFAERPDEIDFRLDELDREWDIERLLQANAGIFSLMGLTFGVMRSRWYILPVAAAAFLIQHAVQGWCPPASLLRRLGVRTTHEINHERYALKALRGDFDSVRRDENLSVEERARRAIEAADANT
jgi:hypothetical protein